MPRRNTLVMLWFGCAALTGCSNEAGGPTAEEQATLEVKDFITAELDGLADAAERLQEAAPKPDDDGFSLKDDRKAVLAMREAWAEARDRYERVEGAIAVLFPNLDASTDERYDGFIEEQADDDLFDGEGVTGVHAIERILWADSIPATVVAFESELDGYEPAAFPANKREADAFKSELAQRLVDDTQTMRDDFEPLALDAASAFRGVVGSLEEQLEKVSLAATAEDESRYAQRTLDDMRANLDGGDKTYAAFRDWVIETAGDETDRDILDGLERLAKAYEGIDGAAIPAVPPDFNPDDPDAKDLKTPYGKLFTLLTSETDPGSKISLVSAMLGAADAMGIAELPE